MQSRSWCVVLTNLFQPELNPPQIDGPRLGSENPALIVCSMKYRSENHSHQKLIALCSPIIFDMAACKRIVRSFYVQLIVQTVF